METPTPYNRHLFYRLARDKRFMAYYLTQYQGKNGLDEAGLALAVGGDQHALFRLGACTAPMPDLSDFEARIHLIAAYTGHQADRLIQVWRSALCLDRKP